MRIYGDKIKKAIYKLREDITELTDEYLAKIFITIKTYVNHYEDAPNKSLFWDKGLEAILDLVYEALIEGYTLTSKTINEIYPKVTSFDIKSIKDLTYIEDGKTLEDRIKAYWTEARIRLDQQQDPDQVNKYLLQRYTVILDTEEKVVEQAVKKNKRPQPESGLYTIQVIDGCGGECEHDCLDLNGIYPIDEDIPWPPYHPNCTGIGYYDVTDSMDEAEEADLDESDNEDILNEDTTESAKEEL